MSHPISATYIDNQVARVAAALGAAGAWDVAPLELQCGSFKNVTLHFRYTRGAANGAFGFRADTCPDYLGVLWNQMTLYSALGVVTNADTQSDLQRESIEYGATAAAVEGFVYGPIELGGNVELIRIGAHETGVIGTPGTLEILAKFGME